MIRSLSSLMIGRSYPEHACERAIIRHVGNPSHKGGMESQRRAPMCAPYLLIFQRRDGESFDPIDMVFVTKCTSVYTTLEEIFAKSSQSM